MVDGYLGSHRTAVERRLLDCISVDDVEGEKELRAELKATRSLEAFLENIRVEGQTAADYITEYQKLKEQEDNADQ